VSYFHPKVRRATYRRQPVAVKLRHFQDSKAQKLFIKEAQILCNVHHPNIVSCYGMCTTLPHMCFVMELLQGSLTHLIKKEGPLEGSLFIRLAYDIACGMNALHESKIIHRDLKPDNILLDGNSTAKIADFGVVAKKLQRPL
jgi:serine/threonine protein kinase